MMMWNSVKMAITKEIGVKELESLWHAHCVYAVSASNDSCTESVAYMHKKVSKEGYSLEISYIT